jgi:hypothetical protein
MAGRLQRELKMTKPFATQEVEAFLNLIRTSDQLTRYFSAVLKPFDLTMGQYNVLRILRGAGHPGLPCGEVPPAWSRGTRTSPGCSTASSGAS